MFVFSEGKDRHFQRMARRNRKKFPFHDVLPCKTGAEISVGDQSVKCGDAIYGKKVSKSPLFWEICLFLRT